MKAKGYTKICSIADIAGIAAIATICLRKDDHGSPDPGDHGDMANFFESPKLLARLIPIISSS